MKKVTLFLLALSLAALSSWKQGGQDYAIRSKVEITASAANLGGFTPPVRKKGTTRLNVKSYGAAGNGIKDDTDAFQKAIDALPGDGGTVFVPSGTYLINGDLKDEKRKYIEGNCIRLRSNMHLELLPGARLKQIPSGAYASCVIFAYQVENVEISGGEIIGERDAHTNTWEGVHGIRIKGSSHVTVRDIKLSDFFGDGMSIGTTDGANKIRGNDIVIDNIVSTNNRRQGLSIGPATNVQVWDSEFSNTKGTAPQCGIDIEPERDQFTDTVLIQNCVMRDNQAYGVLLWKRVRNVTIKECKMTGNNSGIVCEAPVNAQFISNEIHNNRNNGLLLKDSSAVIKVVQNTFYQNNGNTARPSLLKLSGVSPETQKDILIKPLVSDVFLENNIYK